MSTLAKKLHVICIVCLVLRKKEKKNVVAIYLTRRAQIHFLLLFIRRGNGTFHPVAIRHPLRVWITFALLFMIVWFRNFTHRVTLMHLIFITCFSNVLGTVGHSAFLAHINSGLKSGRLWQNEQVYWFYCFRFLSGLPSIFDVLTFILVYCFSFILF